MAVNLKRLVYFDSFMDPIANTIIGRRDDIDLVRLEYSSPETDGHVTYSCAFIHNRTKQCKLRRTGRIGDRSGMPR